ncbi:MAG: site-specific integrase [Nitrospinae bacterium]|nr:site-specific integrase [Nitrospinota bacterium]
MGLYKRQDSPTWWMSFSVNNRQYKRSTGTEDKRLAEAILGKVRGQVIEGKWFPDGDKYLDATFRELSERYLSWADGRLKSAKWKKHIINQLLNHFADFQLTDFTTHSIETYQSLRLQKGNKPATVNRLITNVKHMFTKAYEWELVGEDMLKRVRNVKLLPENNRRLRYLSIEECQTLINACSPHLKPIVITALNTGMRKGEILSLEREKHIDLRHGFILLDVTKNGERREIPINNTMRNLFQKLIPRTDIPYVFYGPDTGKPYGDIKKGFQSAIRRAGIKDFHFHDLRHTFASHLVMAGVDLTTISRLLGHKDIKMTLRYAHLAPAHLTEAVKKLGDILGEKTPVLRGENSLNYPKIRIAESNSLTAVSKTA